MKFAAISHYIIAVFWATSVYAGGSCSSLQQVKVKVHEAKKRRDSTIALKTAIKNNQVVDRKVLLYVATVCAGTPAMAEVLSIAIDHGDIDTVGTLLQNGASLHSSKNSTPKHGLSRRNSSLQPPVKQCWQ